MSGIVIRGEFVNQRQNRCVARLFSRRGRTDDEQNTYPARAPRIEDCQKREYSVGIRRGRLGMLSALTQLSYTDVKLQTYSQVREIELP